MAECTHILLTKIHSSKKISCDAFMKPVDEQLFTLAPHDELEAFVEQTMPRGRQVLGDLEYEFLLFKRKVHAADTEF